LKKSKKVKKSVNKTDKKTDKKTEKKTGNKNSEKNNDFISKREKKIMEVNEFEDFEKYMDQID